LGFTYGYFIQIIDQTKEILDERVNVWAHTAQKMAHEFKTPLGSISLNVSALKNRLRGKKPFLSNDLLDDIITIEGEVLRLKTLTSSFLKITNLEQLSIRDYYLSEILISAVQKFDSYFKSGVILKIDDSINDFLIHVDKTQLLEMIQIVIENAIDAISGDGIIEISAQPHDDKFVQLIIKDNGVGIPLEILDNLFEPYFTTKKDGSGLGLSFAKKIIEDNNGTIEMRSKVGIGTTVLISIPRSIGYP